MLHKIESAREIMFNAHSPYHDGIDGMNLVFAAKVLRDVREALEHGVGFRPGAAESSLGRALKDADQIQELLKQRKAA